MPKQFLVFGDVPPQSHVKREGATLEDAQSSAVAASREYPGCKMFISNVKHGTKHGYALDGDLCADFVDEEAAPDENVQRKSAT